MMKHLTKALALLMLATVILFAVSACASSEKKTSDFPNTQSGFKFTLSEAVLDISQSFKLKEEKDGYIPGAEIKVTVEGNDELSYFEGEITFTWTYEFMNETGDYELDSYEAVVELDATGAGTFKDKIDFEEHRNVKNIQLFLEFEGYASKK